jgi:hypothetical protein
MRAVADSERWRPERTHPGHLAGHAPTGLSQTAHANVVGTAFNSGAIFKRVAFSTDYVACTVTARPQPRSPMGRGRAPGFGKATLHRTVQRRFGRNIIARVKGEKIGRISMDRITHCPKCRKRMVPVVTFSGRTDLQCISCDDPAVKWADSPLKAPEKPIVAEPVAGPRAA